MVFIRKNRDFLWQTVSFRSFGCSMNFGEFQSFSLRQPCCRKSFCASWRRRCWVKLQRVFFFGKVCSRYRATKRCKNEVILRIRSTLPRSNRIEASPTHWQGSSTDDPSSALKKPSYDRFLNMCFDIDIRVEVTSLTSELVPTEIVGASEHNTHEDFAWAEGAPYCTFVYHSKFLPCPGHAFARGGNVLQRAQQKLKNDFSIPNAICTRPFRRQWPTPRWNSMQHLRHFAFQMNIFHARWIRRLWGA